MASTRKLDIAAEASMSVPELNNMITAMRPMMKEAYQSSFHKLKKLRANCESNKKKKQRLTIIEQELDALQKLHIDRISKFALKNDLSWNNISSKGSPMDRAMCRISTQPKVEQYVKNFRNEHGDWKHLAAYLFVKNSSRHMKNEAERIDRFERKRAQLSIEEVRANYEEKGYERQTKEDFIEQKKRRLKNQGISNSSNVSDSSLESDDRRNLDSDSDSSVEGFTEKKGLIEAAPKCVSPVKGSTKVKSDSESSNCVHNEKSKKSKVRHSSDDEDIGSGSEISSNNVTNIDEKKRPKKKRRTKSVNDGQQIEMPSSADVQYDNEDGVHNVQRGMEKDEDLLTDDEADEIDHTFVPHIPDSNKTDHYDIESDSASDGCTESDIDMESSGDQSDSLSDNATDDSSDIGVIHDAKSEEESMVIKQINFSKLKDQDEIITSSGPGDKLGFIFEKPDSTERELDDFFEGGDDFGGGELSEKVKSKDLKPGAFKTNFAEGLTGNSRDDGADEDFSFLEDMMDSSVRKRTVKKFHSSFIGTLKNPHSIKHNQRLRESFQEYGDKIQRKRDRTENKALRKDKTDTKKSGFKSGFQKLDNSGYKPKRDFTKGNPNNLHPSWEASKLRKQQDSRAKFSGTKTIFGADEQGKVQKQNVKALHSTMGSGKGKSVRNKNVMHEDVGKPAKQNDGKFGKQSSSTDQLHPSWQASKKRKEQQSKIQTFTGTKTTFTD